MAAKDRAVCVCLDQDKILVIRRHKDGRDYAVLPGGGIEAGEQPSSAALRELREETSLEGSLRCHLASIDHEDRTAHYFLVSAAGVPRLGEGPEQSLQTSRNRHRPEWVGLCELESVGLVPSAALQLIQDLA